MLGIHSKLKLSNQSTERPMEYLQKARRNVSLAVNHALIAKHSTDQYIVAFPRSGSTWLRTILGGLIEPENGFEPAVFNVLIPSVGLGRMKLVWALQDPRIIMSHTTFRPRLRRVVYMVRDGRDAVVSFYHLGTTRQGRKMPFPEWFEGYCNRQYGPRWDENVTGWLTKGRQHLGDNLLLVKFEDLKKAPMPFIEKIAKYLGIPADEQSMSRAIEMAGLDKAREREKLEKGKISDPNASFYRGGKTGQWQEYLSGPLYQRFMELSGSALKLAGYSE
jgi:estrone sulfotransferase